MTKIKAGDTVVVSGKSYKVVWEDEAQPYFRIPLTGNIPVYKPPTNETEKKFGGYNGFPPEVIEKHIPNKNKSIEEWL